MRPCFCFLAIMGLVSSVATLAAQDSRDLYPRVAPQVLYLRHELKADASRSKQVELWKRFEAAVETTFLDSFQVVASGSGFFVDDQGRAMTNRHVVQVTDLESLRSGLLGNLDRTVENLDSRFSPADRAALKADARLVIRFDSYRFSAWTGTQFLGEVKVLATTSPKEVDLALVRVEGVHSVPLPLALVDAVGSSMVGRGVSSFGYPLGDSLDSMFKERVVTMNKGAVSAFRGNELLDLQHTAAISGGNSGGPLVDDAGRVVGVNTALIAGKGNSLYYAASALSVRKFLREKGFAQLVLWNDRLSKIASDADIGLRRNDAGEWEAPRTLVVEGSATTTIEFNGKVLGQGVQALILNPGVNQLVLQQDGVRDEYALRLVPDLSTPAALKPRQQSLTRVTFRTEPAGASVWADGRLLGTTPFEAPLPSDIYSLRLTQEGWAYPDEALVVGQDRLQTWSATGIPAQTLSVKASGTLEGATWKFTSADRTFTIEGLDHLQVPAGTYTLKVEGLASLADREITLSLDEKAPQLDLRSHQRLGRLVLKGWTTGSRVWVDGVETPWSIEGSDLALGRHLIKAEKAGLRTMEETAVTVRPSGSFLVWSTQEGVQVHNPGLFGSGLFSAGLGVVAAAAGWVLSFDAIAVPSTKTFEEYTFWKQSTLGSLGVGAAVAIVGGVMVGISLASDPLVALSSDDCLVLVPTKMMNPDAIPMARKYRLLIGKKEYRISEAKEDYVAILVHGPTAITGLSSKVEAEGFRGESFQVKLAIDLPYRPGEVVVADRTFLFSLEKVGDRSYMSRSDFVDTASDVSQRVLKAFKGSSAAKTWVVSP